MPIQLSAEELRFVQEASPRQPAIAASASTRAADAVASACDFRCEASLALAMRDAAAAGDSLSWDGWDGDGRAPLAIAAAKGWVAGVRALLDAGAAPSRLSRDGSSPLDAAFSCQDAERAEQTARLLLSRGSDPDAGSSSALGRAAEELSAAAQSLSRAQHSAGNRMLSVDVRSLAEQDVAVFLRRERVAQATIRLLLVFGVDPNKPGPSGAPPLCVAAAHSLGPLCDALLDAGADAQGVDPRTGRSALHELLDRVDGQFTPALRARIERALLSGVDAEARSRLGSTAAGILEQQRGLIAPDVFGEISAQIDRARILKELRKAAPAGDGAPPVRPRSSRL
jgi:ankyrin repeat protein